MPLSSKRSVEDYHYSAGTPHFNKQQPKSTQYRWLWVGVSITTTDSPCHLKNLLQGLCVGLRYCIYWLSIPEDSLVQKMSGWVCILVFLLGTPANATPDYYRDREPYSVNCQADTGDSLGYMGIVQAAPADGLKLTFNDMSNNPVLKFAPNTDYKLFVSSGSLGSSSFLASCSAGTLSGGGQTAYSRPGCSSVQNSCGPAFCGSEQTFKWTWRSPVSGSAESVDFIVVGGNIGSMQRFQVSICSEQSTTCSQAVEPPGPPAMVALTIGCGDKKLALKWEAPVKSGTYPVTNYTIFYRKTADPLASTASLTVGLDTRATLTGLSPATSYTITVAGNSQAGAGMPSEPVALSTFAVPPMAPEPPVLTVQSFSSRMVNLSWTEPNLHEYPLYTAGAYAVEWKLAAQPAWNDTQLTNERFFTVSSLQPQTAYEFRVSTRTLADVSAPSAVLAQTTGTDSACEEACNNQGECMDGTCYCYWGFLGKTCALQGFTGCFDAGYCYALARKVQDASAGVGELYVQTALALSAGTGWHGLLVNSDKGGMSNADCWIMTYKGESAQLDDRWSANQATPNFDAEMRMDLHLFTAERNVSHTVFHFKRNLTVPDRAHDRDIGVTGGIKLGWAYQVSSTDFVYHNSARGRELTINPDTGAVEDAEIASKSQIWAYIVVIIASIVLGLLMIWFTSGGGKPGGMVNTLRYGKPFRTVSSPDVLSIVHFTTEKSWLELFWLALYFAANIAFVLVAYVNLKEIGKGVEYALGQWAAVSIAFVLFPPVRNGIWVVAMGIPFERAIQYHRVMGRVAFMAVVFHFFFMLARYGSGWDGQILGSYVKNDYGLGIGFGFLALCFLVVGMAVTLVRRHNYEIFRIGHYFMIVSVILAALHSYLFCYLLIAPGVLLVVDWLLRYCWVAEHPQVTAVPIPNSSGGSDVTLLKMKFGKPFKFEAGDYVFLSIPGISRLEQHPFSISSAPADGVGKNSITCHIKNMGPGTFTGQLLDQVHNQKLRQVYVEGPYGKVSVDYATYPSVVLVAGGIGATPMMSILGDLVGKMRNESKGDNPTGQCAVKHVTLVWADRDLSAFKNWFSPLLLQAAKTQGVGLQLFHTRGDKMQTTAAGLITPGRPQLDQIFSNIPGANVPGQVCCLACGPAPLVEEAENASCDLGWPFHKETFFL
eukprot:g66036.t1